jgi:hypothetical protein
MLFVMQQCANTLIQDSRHLSHFRIQQRDVGLGFSHPVKPTSK